MKKILDFSRLCDEYDIDCASEGSRHYHEGWISIECPFCTGNPGHHLGFNIEENYFNCWRCGYKSNYTVLKRLLHLEGSLLRHKINSYLDDNVHTVKHESIKEQLNKCLKLPPGTDVLKKMHRQYLRKRKFDPIKLQQIWGILGTGNIGPFCFRIVIPIYFKGKLVSYQGRDISGRAKLRYKNCPKEKEVVHLKNIVYGFDNVPDKSVIICEGVTDVWRLGPGAVATFGVGFTPKQAKLLGEKFDKRFILYDQDKAGEIRAKRLAVKLAMYDGVTSIIKLKEYTGKDPGEMPQEDADKITRELLNNEN